MVDSSVRVCDPPRSGLTRGSGSNQGDTRLYSQQIRAKCAKSERKDDIHAISTILQCSSREAKENNKQNVSCDHSL